jgi:Cd2+/Zn2+-exporting ATPase
MAVEIRTLTLPLHPAPLIEAEPLSEWRRRWHFRQPDCWQCAETLVKALSPRVGVYSTQIDRAAGTLTLEYDPDRFSLDQAKALARDVGLILEGTVHHCILDLPDAARAEYACPLERRLMHIPGVTHAALNPLARTLTVEYLDGAEITNTDIISRLREWGYRARDIGKPEGWWDRHRLTVYTVTTAIALLMAWLLERSGGAQHAAPVLLVTGLAVVAYVAGGGFATLNGLRALRQGQIDVDTLMVSAALGAAVIGEWLEGGILLFLFALSNALEHYAMDRTRQAIRALMDLRPEQALVRRDGQEMTVSVEELVVGDLVIVRPGERLPADGEVAAGESAVDQSPITGESIPVQKAVGDPVFAGTINGHGTLDVRVAKRAEETTLARIIQLVEEAQSERAPTQKRLDDFEQKYAVVIIGVAALVAVLPPLLLGWAWSSAFYRAMTLLVVASPCALVISTPASILSAVAAGARQGVLFKGGAHVESLAGVKVVAFDKTGTLTVGKPQVTDVIPLNGVAEPELLATAAAVEARSEHPLAQAVVAAAQARELDIAEAVNLQAVAGKGVTALLNGRAVHIGTNEHLRDNGHAISSDVLQQMERLEAQGKTVMLVGDTAQSQIADRGSLIADRGIRHTRSAIRDLRYTSRLMGLIAVADTVRPEAAQAVAALKAAGIEKVVMLTGDNPRAAQAIGAQAGVDEVRAELLPEEKVAAVKSLLDEHSSVAMVGDGVNDAPALARASVGIAMGAGGTDVALETADVVLMASDLSKLPYAVGLSRRAMRIVRQNLAFALTVIGVLIVSTFLNVISLPIGVVGHEGSTVVVVLNGLRLLRGRS